MKTTIQISDAIFNEARKLAREEHTTMKDLVEAGLRRVISEHRQRERFKLRKATFSGKGLQSHLEGASWDKIRDMSYEGRGG